MYKRSGKTHPIVELMPDDASTYVINGLDDALLGVTDIGGKFYAVYSVEWIVKSLMKTNKWSREDAIDFAYYNIIQNNFAGQMPIFVDTMQNIRRTK
jgi:hypothetical protein